MRHQEENAENHKPLDEQVGAGTLKYKQHLVDNECK